MKFQQVSLLVPGLLWFSFSWSTLHAQHKEEVPVLLNTEPVLAVVNDSAEIVEVVKSLPGYMEGYQLEVMDYVPKESQVNTTSSNTGYSIISSESYTLPFQSGFAVLEDEAVLVLDQLIMHLKEHPKKSFLLSVYNESLTNTLYKNRINAIKAYLKIEGLSLDRFKLNYLEGSSNQDEFKVNYIE